MAFRTEFDERREPSKCCIQKLVKKLKTRVSRSNACWLLSLGPIEGQSVQKFTTHNRTTQRRCTPKDSSRQRQQFGKSIPEFGETHSSVLWCERRPVSASIMSRSCFASFPVCVYKFSSHYLNNVIFIDNSLGPLARDSPCTSAAYHQRNQPTHVTDGVTVTSISAGLQHIRVASDSLWQVSFNRKISPIVYGKSH